MFLLPAVFWLALLCLVTVPYKNYRCCVGDDRLLTLEPLDEARTLRHSVIHLCRRMLAGAKVEVKKLQIKHVSGVAHSYKSVLQFSARKV